MRPVDDAIQQKHTGTKMKFLDINLTKTRVFCTMLFTAPSSLVSKIHCTKSTKQRKLESIHEKHFVERKNEGRKKQTKLESEKTRFYAQKPRLKTLFKNSISVHTGTHRHVTLL